MAEANLLEGDLLEILAIWPEEAWNKKFRMFKIARRICAPQTAIRRRFHY